MENTKDYAKDEVDMYVIKYSYKVNRRLITHNALSLVIPLFESKELYVVCTQEHTPCVRVHTHTQTNQIMVVFETGNAK